MRTAGNTNQRHFCTQNPLLKRKGNYVAEKRTQTKKKKGKLTQKNKKSHQDMEERRQIYREILKNFTIMSDAFMRNVLKEKACTEYILQVIMGESELTVEDQVIQHDYKNLQGRSTIMDCVATDQKNRQMNIEIQQESKDASPQRSRYNSALLDMNTLNPGQSVKELPESYIIFITREDVMKEGLPIYHIQRNVNNTNRAFGDGSHILYVNSQIQNDTKLGRLMHDLHCKNADEMYSEVLAARVRQLKETPEGVEYMCKEMDRIYGMGELEGEKKGVKWGRAMERKNTEHERKKAERERKKAEIEKNRADRLAEELERYREKYGVLA